MNKNTPLAERKVGMAKIEAAIDARCHRCNGKGMFTFRRVHMGVPGLCFRCDGTGREPDELDAYIQAKVDEFWAPPEGCEPYCDDREKRLYPPTVWSGDKQVPYECYFDAVKTKKIGDVVRSHAGAPGVGHIDSRITRIDDTGVYAIEIENTIWVPGGEYYR